jgi:branched-chain amino acid transport system substrate-binding protein
MVEVLRKCGDDLSREKFHQAGHQHSRAPAADVLPGLTINVTPSDRIGWRKARMARFDGT